MRYAVYCLLIVSTVGCGRPAATLAHGKPLSDWLQAVHDPDARIRQKAVHVLGNIGPIDPAVVPALTEAVADKDAHVRSEAVQALSKFGPAARPALTALTQAQNQDKDAKVRAAAAKALEKIQANP